MPPSKAIQLSAIIEADEPSLPSPPPRRQELKRGRPTPFGVLAFNDGPPSTIQFPDRTGVPAIARAIAVAAVAPTAQEEYLAAATTDDEPERVHAGDGPARKRTGRPARATNISSSTRALSDGMRARSCYSGPSLITGPTTVLHCSRRAREFPAGRPRRRRQVQNHALRDDDRHPRAASARPRP
jgi:hypothetical protein